MVHWFKDNVYLAAWVSPLIALVGLLIRNGPSNPYRIAWSRVMVYVVFLSCLAAALTPALDLPTRFFAGTTMSFILGYLLMGGLRD